MTFLDTATQAPDNTTGLPFQSPGIMGDSVGGELSDTDPRIARQAQQAQNLQSLAAQHPWMPPEVMSGLATSGMQADSLGPAAEALRQAATAAGQGIAHVYSDPTLQKRPTTAAAVQDWLSQAIGPPPISQVDIATTQQNLQKQGLAPAGGEANGIWTPAWQAAFKQAHQQSVNDQLAGNQPGGVTFGKALHWLTSVLPKESGNALIGFVKSIPHDVRQLAADSVAGVVDTGGSAATLLTLGHGVNMSQVHRAVAATGGFVMGQNPQQYAQQFGGNASLDKAGYGHVTGRLVEDIGTLFLLDGLAKAGAKIGGSIVGQEAAKTAEGSIASRAVQGFRATGPGRLQTIQDLELEDAYRGPGVIARTVGRTADLGNANWLKNIPVLGQVGPWVGQLNDADGLYYRARTLMATPYTYMPVRAAGTAVHAAGIIGAEARGIAAVANKADPNNPLSADIEQTRTLNAVDDALRNKTTLTVFGKRFSPAIDDLAFFLHAPEPGISNAIIGGQARDAMASLDRALGPDSTISAQIERGTGQTWDKLGKAAGGDEEGLKRFWTNKVKQAAASHYAENAINGMKNGGGVPAFGSPDFIRLARQFQHEAWTDPAVMQQSLGQMLTNTDQLANWIRKDVTTSGTDALAYQRQGLGEFLPASKIMREVVAPAKDMLMGKIGIGDTTGIGDGQVGGPFQLGLARNETLTQDQAHAAAQGFQTRLQDLDQRQADFSQATNEASDINASDGSLKTLEKTKTNLPTVTEYQQLDREVSQFMSDHFGIDARRMPHDLAPKINELQTQAGLLAGPAVYNRDELPDHIVKALDQLRDLGYKPVIGQDIGHQYEDTPLLDVVSDGITWRRKAAEAIGLSTEHIPTQTIGAYRYQSIRAELQKLVDKGMPLPPYYTVDTILHDLRDDGLLDYAQGSAKGAIQRLFGGLHARNVTQAMDAARTLPDYADLSDADLRRVIEGRMADEANMGLQLRDIPRKRIVKLLTKPRNDMPEVEQGLSRLARNKAAVAGKWADDARVGQVAEPMSTDLVSQFADPLKSSATVADPKAFHGLTKSLLHDGFDQPVTLRYNPGNNQAVLGDGYARLQAAQEAGLEHIPVQVEIDHGLTDGTPFGGAIGTPGRMRSGEVVSPTRLFGDAGQPEEQLAPLALPHFSEPQANDIYRAVVKGSSKVPIRYMGISKLEDMMRAGLGFAGDAVPGNFGEAIANLPNRLIQIRNNLRFDLNPEFAVRRVAKTNLKLGIEGVTPTIDPVGKMIAGGTLDSDRALLNRISPNQFAKQNEEVESFLRHQDIFGLYSHRDYQAYAAGELQRMGKTDEDIKGTLSRAFSYGTYAGEEGRSAAERSVNFMFFPFSFDKTVYRNLGAYLLDRPAQLYVASAGLSAFNQFNQAHPDSPLAKAWVDKHLPAMEELLRLNMFAHGVSLGEPGGINAPLINFFLPQVVSAANPDAAKTLRRVAPAYKEFSNIWKQMVQQGHIVGTESGNLWDQFIKRQPTDPFTAVRNPAETPYQQAVDGQKYYQDLQGQFKPYLDWNTKHSSDPNNQYKLPIDPKFGKYAGGKIDSTMVRNMVHSRYPGYDPTFSAELGIKDNQAIQDFVYSVAGTPMAGRVANLLDIARKYRGYINNGQYDSNPQAATQATMAIRKEATDLAEQNPKFFQLWDKVFASTFGPLEAK